MPFLIYQYLYFDTFRPHIHEQYKTSIKKNTPEVNSKSAFGVTLNLLFFFTKELARHLLEGADKFDTRWWAAAVGVVMGTLFLLGMGTCAMLYQELKMPPGE